MCLKIEISQYSSQTLEYSDIQSYLAMEQITGFSVDLSLINFQLPNEVLTEGVKLMNIEKTKFSETREASISLAQSGLFFRSSEL